MKEITINDIANQLKISKSTVSRALNDDSKVNDGTKMKVVDMAGQLGYRLNNFASDLLSKHTNILGVIVPSIRGPLMSEVIAGIESVVNNEGYSLVICQSGGDIKKEVKNALKMFNNRIDGLMVSLAGDTSKTRHFNVFFKKDIPVLFFDRVPDDDRLPSVIIDTGKAGYEATSHLIRRGCRRIFFISGGHRAGADRDLYNGYLRALKEYGLTESGEFIISWNTGEQDAVLAAEKVISSGADGVIATNHTTAMICLDEFKRRGIRIPEDIAVCGFNDSLLSQIVSPSLTTINYPAYEMGECLAKSLIQHLRSADGSSKMQSLKLKADLLIMESSGHA